MADEVKAGDVLSYTASGFSAPLAGTWDALRLYVTSHLPGGLALVDSAAGDYSFSVRVRATTDRARLADIKGNLDAVLAQMAGQSYSTQLDFVSQVSRDRQPPVTTPPTTTTTPAGSTSFISGIAKSMGVSESNAWLLVLGGAAALLLMVKK